MNRIAIFTVTFCCFVASAQNVPSRQNTQTGVNSSTVSSKEGFFNHRFDPKTLSVPKHFRGVDLKLLIDKISTSKALSSKSEFETTEQYLQRKSSFQDSALIEDFNPTSQIAIVFDPGTSFALEGEVTYDADTQSFAVAVKFQRNKLLIETSGPAYYKLDIHNKLTKSEEYSASNATGARTEVHSTQSESYGIAIATNHWLMKKNTEQPEYQLSREAVFRVNAPLDSASILKSQLRIAFVGKMMEPYLLHDVFSTTPTFSDPIKISIRQKYLIFFPSEVIVFRSDTGEILLRERATT